MSGRSSSVVGWDEARHLFVLSIPWSFGSPTFSRYTFYDHVTDHDGAPRVCARGELQRHGRDSAARARGATCVGNHPRKAERRYVLAPARGCDRHGRARGFPCCASSGEAEKRARVAPPPGRRYGDPISEQPPRFGSSVQPSIQDASIDIRSRAAYERACSPLRADDSPGTHTSLPHHGRPAPHRADRGGRVCHEAVMGQR
jgi:hypothetical protein